MFRKLIKAKPLKMLSGLSLCILLGSFMGCPAQDTPQQPKETHSKLLKEGEGYISVGDLKASLLIADRNQDQFTAQAERETLQSLFKTQQFETLEAKFNALRINYGKTATLDRDALESAYDFLAWQDIPDKELLNLLSIWQKKLPQAITPYLIQASLYIHNADDARGTGFAYQVTDKDAETFANLMGKSIEVLHLADQKFLIKEDAELYLSKLEAAFGLPVSNKERLQVFMQGIRIEPDYERLYIEMGQALLPRWFGNPGDLKRFVDWLAERESDPRIYARFAAAAITPRSTLQDVREYDLPWAKIKQGFFELARDKRLTTANMHQFCWLATAYQDRPTAKLIFDALGNEPGQVWQSVENQTQARDWANGKLEHCTYQIPEALLKPVKQ